MKPPTSEKNHRALTRIELLVVIAVVVSLAIMVLTGLGESRRQSVRIDCANNMKQFGLAFPLFVPDSGPLTYPARRSMTNGETAKVASDVWRDFLVLSNEVKSLKLLICPADTRRPAKSWATLANTNISYFVSLDADEAQPGILLFGDRNLTNGPLLAGGILELKPNSPVGWTHELHNRVGNVTWADGHIGQLSSAKLRQAVANSGVTNRLAIP